MASVSFRAVNRIFPGGQHAVRDFDLDVADGEFVVLVGPSGCGKTTVLRMTAGLEDISSGTILVDGAPVNDVEPRRRDVAMVFQEYALYPQMTVFENIAFSLKLRKLDRAEIRSRVVAMARTLDIEELLERKPRALSGGQRQRVAMGRALVRDPKVFLMDEPLSNLDAKLRVQMRHEVSRIQRELGTTTIYVTHDQIEAMTMGQRVAVMLDGAIQQVDTPQALYDRPANMFVAAFIGSPEMNLIRVRLERDAEGFTCLAGGQRLALPRKAARNAAALESFAGREIVLGLRPAALEDAALVPERVRPGSTMRGETAAVEILGVERLVQVVFPDVTVVTGDLLEAGRTDGEDEAGDGSVAAPRLDSVVVGRFGPASPAAVGDALEVVVDMNQAHLFDPDTRLPI
jgi:multiple sugar transport system ATP-binding protein